VGNVGSLSWFATTFLEQHYSFTIAYSITLASMVVAMLMLFFGAKWYGMLRALYSLRKTGHSPYLQ
jgi:POT family proton-dependent oligopeptide transporter